MLNKEEFAAWKQHPGTQAVKAIVIEWVRMQQVSLAKQAGMDSSADRYRSGYLNGIEDVLFNMDDLLVFQEETPKNDEDLSSGPSGSY